VKLLGVEFENFARFDKCFVPLDPGITLLVGKNNSGKTALLRGLSVLSGLSFHDRAKLDRNLTGYIRGAPKTQHFTIHVLFEYEAGDNRHIQMPEGDWPKWVEEKRPIARFAFTIWPFEDAAALEGCTLSVGNVNLKILERREPKGQLISNVFDSQGNPRDSQPLPLPEHLPKSPDGMFLQLHGRDGILAGFKETQAVRIVHAHRSVRESLQARQATVLAPTGEDLAPFLLTLQNWNRDQFNEICDFVRTVFPALRYVNAEMAEGNVNITLDLDKDGSKVSLTHCGSGVEQVLTLATFVVTSPPGAIILLDEPHSYLHPNAERELISFLRNHPVHRYVMATHSAILINSVPPDRILFLDGEMKVERQETKSAHVSEILSLLGYRNSDLLFADRLIFVEGTSDSEILPILLKNMGKWNPEEIDAKTRFPDTEGSENRSGKDLDKQTVILRYEKMIEQLGRGSVPRAYLRDGDVSPGEKTLLDKLNRLTVGKPKVRFLRRSEIENYLLVSEAMAKAISAQAELDGTEVPDLSSEGIEKILAETVSGNDKELFPRGKETDPLICAKGSVVLRRIYDRFGLSYSKKSSGRLIANHITSRNQPALEEIYDLVKDLFS